MKRKKFLKLSPHHPLKATLSGAGRMHPSCPPCVLCILMWFMFMNKTALYHKTRMKRRKLNFTKSLTILFLF
jgi:hypothetical protein